MVYYSELLSSLLGAKTSKTLATVFGIFAAENTVSCARVNGPYKTENAQKRIKRTKTHKTAQKCTKRIKMHKNAQKRTKCTKTHKNARKRTKTH